LVIALFGIHGYQEQMNNLQKIRESKKLTRERLAEIIGTTATTIYRKETGIRGLRADELEKYANALECEPYELIVSAEKLVSLDAESAKSVPIVGSVGAGAKIYPIDDHAKGQGLDTADCPPGMNSEKTVAVFVKGDSMEPLLSEGWLLYYDERIFGVPEEYIGCICVVKIASADNGDEGATLVKKIKRGDKVGHYHLCSINPLEEPILNKSIEWSAKVKFMGQR
jgi:transcriptional regulator with XRE-family HTH domain